MASEQFARMSSRTFEELARALAIGVFGPGVSAFGKGPDGGREATFRGPVPYPSNVQQWNGYGVVQAKFKERVVSADKDTSWVMDNIEKELKEWITSNKRTPKPDYIVFCTNVDLPSAPGGGRDKVNDLIKQYAPQLDLKDWTLWDANQMTALIDINEQVRRRFLHFFTPGDLLAAMASHFSNVPNADQVLSAYLRRKLLAEEVVRTSQANDKSDEKIHLADVFIDIPSIDSTHAKFSSSDPPADSLRRLLGAGECKLDPAALDKEDDLEEESNDTKSRHLYVGGPGSGKSTLGQFLCQVHRAALLNRREKARLDPDIRKVIRNIEERCSMDDYEWPKAPRFPIRIELNAFAKSLASDENEVNSVIDYILADFQRDFTVTKQDFHAWLSQYAWLVVFDGLDEVPSASNRSSVVSEIKAFLALATDLECDMMVVSSSRAEGYAGELDGREVETHLLAPLNTTQAIACAEKYIKEKFGHDPQGEGASTLAIIKSAAVDPLVANIMISPLQVAFMVTVVANGGPPSESRWQLFQQYYETIYTRELQKGIAPADKVLAQWKQQIDFIHTRVGLVLQINGERTGGTEAEYPMQDFEVLVSEQLSRFEIDDDKLARIKASIDSAAKQRLVFLTNRSSTGLSFDVRSLQEFMAARYITDHEATEIAPILAGIAHSDYWRNTVLFAVDRLFFESRFTRYQDKVWTLCHMLNTDEGEREATKAGSRLALHILNAGIVGKAPKFGRALIKSGLEALQLPLHSRSSIPSDIATAYRSEFEQEVREVVIPMLSATSGVHLHAWTLLLLLVQHGHSWAQELSEEMWPNDRERQWRIITHRFERTNFEYLPSLTKIELNSFADQFLQRPFVEFYNIASYSMSVGDNAIDNFVAIVSSNTPDDDLRCSIDVVGPDGSRTKSVLLISNSLEARTLFKNAAETLKQREHHESWSVLLHFEDYFKDPSPENLLKCASCVQASVEKAQIQHWIHLMPWPIAAMLNAICQYDDQISLLDEFAGSPLSTPDVLYESETLWREEGVSLDWLLTSAGASRIPLVGGVHTLTTTHTSRDADSSSVLRMLDAAESATGVAQSVYLWWFTFNARGKKVLPRVDPVMLRGLLESNPNSQRGFILHLLESFPIDSSEWITFAEKVGDDTGFESFNYSIPASKRSIEKWFEVYLNDVSRIGILKLVLFSCQAQTYLIPTTFNFEDIKRSKSTIAKLLLIMLRMLDNRLSIDEASWINDHISLLLEEYPDCRKLALKCYRAIYRDHDVRVAMLPSMLRVAVAVGGSEEALLLETRSKWLRSDRPQEPFFDI